MFSLGHPGLPLHTELLKQFNALERQFMLMPHQTLNLESVWATRLCGAQRKTWKDDVDLVKHL